MADDDADDDKADPSSEFSLANIAPEFIEQQVDALGKIVERASQKQAKNTEIAAALGAFVGGLVGIAFVALDIAFTHVCGPPLATGVVMLAMGMGWSFARQRRTQKLLPEDVGQIADMCQELLDRRLRAIEDAGLPPERAAEMRASAHADYHEAMRSLTKQITPSTTQEPPDA